MIFPKRGWNYKEIISYFGTTLSSLNKIKKEVYAMFQIKYIEYWIKNRNKWRDVSIILNKS